MDQQTKPFKVYQASAGSGKTYTIVKEYLGLCLKDEASTANYSSILAITFTNKSANDMKEKIMSHLNTIINSDDRQEPKDMEADLINELGVKRSELKKNAKTLFHKIIHDYSSFCVCTIDSFYQKLARAFAKDLKLPTQFNVSIDQDEVADAITERLSEQLGPANPFLTTILNDFCEKEFEEEKKAQVANEINSFVKQLFEEDSFQRNEQNHFQTEEQYKETIKHLDTFYKTFEKKCKEFVERFDSFVQKNNYIIDDFNFRSTNPVVSLVENLRKGKYVMLGVRQNDFLSGNFALYSKKRKPGPNDDELEQKSKRFFEEYDKDIRQYLFYHYQHKSLSFYVLRSIIKAEIEAYIGEEMVVHITEFNKRINDILGDFSVPFIYERLGEHFHHIFIDEFQDTSVLQWQNIIPLIDNNLSNKELNMVVGDGKQSIYRWRNGEVGQIASLPKIYKKPEGSPVFDEFEQNFTNNLNFNRLEYNYRSFKNIVHFNNDFFYSNASLLPEEVRKVYCFDDKKSIEQKTVKKHDGLVQVELFDSDNASDDIILDRIKEIIDELMQHKFNKGDIAILVRKNDQGSMIATYLHDKGIEVISPEAILLNSSERVQLIISTLAYLIHPDNKAIIADVLYHWKVTHDQDFKGDVSQVFTNVSKIASGEASIEKEMHLKASLLSDLLANSYSLYDLCSALARAYEFNTLDDSFVHFLLDTVYKWQSTDEYGIEQFLNYWEKKKKKLSIITNDIDAVNIMTIHKSKGLEFPVVIYPFVKDDIDSNQAKSKWYTVEELGFEPIPNIAKVKFSFSNDRNQWSHQIAKLSKAEDSSVRLDNMNLNYVAFTRPQQRLYVMTYKSDDMSKSTINAFFQNPPQAEDDESPKFQKVEQQDGAAIETVYRLGDASQDKVEKKSDEEGGVQEFFHDSASGDWFSKISIDPDPSMFWMTEADSFEPQEWGKLVHKILSEVEHADDLDKVLKQYFDNGIIDESTTDMLKKVFQMMVGDPLISEAFSSQAKVRNESELLTENDTKRPDRFAELPEKIYLLDYKTGQPRKENEAQLLEYKHILKDMVNKEIDAYLVYIRQDHIDVVPVK